MKKKLIIGSHVSMKAPDYLLQSVKDAVRYNANTFMFYTGAPQNVIRKPVTSLKIAEFHEALQEHDIAIENVIVHAPYLINLANIVRAGVFAFSVDFLVKELQRCAEIGIQTIVLHPGSTVKGDLKASLLQVSQGLDLALAQEKRVKIALETMSGKGSEVGATFEQLQEIINNCQYKDLIGVCFDTCHLYTAGYDLINNLDGVIAEFDAKIGLDKLLCLHINDSMHGLGTHKDRHMNLEKGVLGKHLYKILAHKALFGRIMILETPWVNDHPPYKGEIAQIRKYLAHE